MRRGLFSAGALAAAVFVAPARGQGGAPAILEDRDRAVAVLTIFATKCAQCHGPHLKEPEGEMGFILDLPRLIDRKVVIPGDPDRSKLFRQIARGKMPPKEAKAGPLTPEETEVIRAWIQGSGAGSGTEAGAAPPAPSTSPVPKPLVFLGRLHPLVVHFPIALLLTAALADILTWRTPRPGLGQVRTICAVLGALGAAAAAGLGWLNAWADHKTGDTLDLHRWLGTGGAAAAVMGAVAVWAWGTGKRAALARAALLASAALVGVAAHFGGMMVFGSGYFSP